VKSGGIWKTISRNFSPQNENQMKRTTMALISLFSFYVTHKTVVKNV